MYDILITININISRYMRSSMEYRTNQSNPLERKSRHMHAARETSNLITFKEKNHRHCMPGIHPIRRKTPNKQSTNTL